MSNHLIFGILRYCQTWKCAALGKYLLPFRKRFSMKTKVYTILAHNVLLKKCSLKRGRFKQWINLWMKNALFTWRKCRSKQVSPVCTRTCIVRRFKLLCSLEDMNSQVDVGAVRVDGVCLSTIPGGYLIQTQELLEAADSRTPSRWSNVCFFLLVFWQEKRAKQMIMSDDVFCMFAFLNRGKCVVLNVDGLKFNVWLFQEYQGRRSELWCQDCMFEFNVLFSGDLTLPRWRQ